MKRALKVKMQGAGDWFVMREKGVGVRETDKNSGRLVQDAGD